MNNNAPIKPIIEKHGQPYVDEAIYVDPRAEGPIANGIRQAFGGPQPKRLLVGYQMTRLNWVKP